MNLTIRQLNNHPNHVYRNCFAIIKTIDQIEDAGSYSKVKGTHEGQMFRSTVIRFSSDFVLELE